MWAKEVSGVGDAKCLPLWNGNGTVKVVIINADKGAASSELISAVKQHIEENRPIGAAVTVESAVPLAINVSVSLTLANGVDIQTAKEKISESITKYIKKNAFANAYISYAQIGGCILDCAEVLDYSGLRINGGIDNIEKLPSYYRKSKVMQELMQSLELEMERLRSAVQLTENQFFVLLADKNLAEHEKDVGLNPDLSTDLESRRGRVLSRLRGTGTVTKTMIKNVAASFVNGEIEITEYPSQYLFSVAFTSKQGIPYNLTDIQNMIEEIKPAHLAVEYIFTYRL